MDEHEIVRLQMRVEALENKERELEGKLQDLNDRYTAITSTLKVGKGMLIGVVFVLGSAGLAVGQSLKRLWNL